MQLIKLKDEEPPRYQFFTAFNEESSEYFKNYLVRSEYNYFYIAGKKFTHWLKEG